MNTQDQVITALTAWRENRGAGRPGIQSIINVIQNRMRRKQVSAWFVCTEHEQFSSLTAKGDPELTLWPTDQDQMWQLALELAAQAAAGALEDLTGGADLYFAPKGQQWKQRFTLPDGTEVPFPDSWNKNVVTYTTSIGSQLFFR